MHVPMLAVPHISPGAGAQDKAGDDEALGLVRLLGQIHVVLAHFGSCGGGGPGLAKRVPRLDLVKPQRAVRLNGFVNAVCRAKLCTPRKILYAAQRARRAQPPGDARSVVARASSVALRSRRAWLPSWEERVRWKVAAVAIHGASVDVVGRQQRCRARWRR